jgi:hypothetical protein
MKINSFFKSKFFFGFALILSTFAFGVVFIPFLASIPGIQSKLIKYAKKNFEGDLEIKGLKLGWFSETKISELSYKNKSSSLNLEIRNLSSSWSLINLLVQPIKTPLTDIEFMELFLDPKKASSKEPISLPFFLKSVAVNEANVSILTKENHLAKFSKVKLVSLIEHERIFAKTKGLSNYKGIDGNFDIKVEMDFDKETHLANISTSNLPLEPLDAALNLEDQLSLIGGPFLNSSISFFLTPQSLRCQANAVSETIKIALSTEESESGVALKSPSFASLTLSPKLAKKIKGSAKISEHLLLAKEGSLQLFIDSCSIPLVDGYLKFKETAFQSRLFSSTINLQTAKSNKTILFNPSTLFLSSKAIGKEVECSFKSSLNYNLKNPSFINASLALKSSLASYQIKNFDLTISKFPLEVLEFLSISSLPWSKTLGASVDLNVKTTADGDKNGIRASISTPLFDLQNLFCSLNQDQLTLTTPTDYTYALKKSNMELISKYLPLSIASDSLIRGKIEKLEVPLNPLNLDSLGNTLLAFSVKGEEFIANFNGVADPIKIKNSSLYITFESLNKAIAEGTVLIASGAPFLKDLDPTSSLFNITFKTNGENLFTQDAQIPYLEINGENSRYKIRAVCGLENKLKKLTFFEPITFEAIPTSEMMKSIFNQNSSFITYSVNYPFKFSLTASPLDLDSNFFPSLLLEGVASNQELKVLNLADRSEFRFENLNLKFKASGKDSSFNGELGCDLSFNDSQVNKGAFDVKFDSKDFKNLNIFSREFLCSIQLNQIPSSLLDTLGNYDKAFETLFGKEFTSNIQILNKDSNQKFIAGDFASTGAQAIFDIKVNESSVELGKEKIQAKLVLNEDSYSALEQIFSYDTLAEQSIALGEKALVDIKVDELSWKKSDSLAFSKNTSLFEKTLQTLNHHLKESFFYATITTKKLELYSRKTKEKTTLDQFSAQCVKTKGNTPFSLEISSNIESSLSNEKGHFLSKINIESIQKENNKTAVSSKISTKFINFPTLILDSIFKFTNFTKIPPSVLLGEKIDGSFNSQLENLTGTVDFEVDSKECKGNVNAYITNEAIKLYQPINAQIAISPKLADFFLNNMNVSLTKSTEPLTLFIDNKGFYFPIDHFNMKQMQIRKGVINLHQIQCKNTGNPQEIGGFFKLNLSKNNLIDLWFAPMEFSLSSGNLYIDRTEVLYNKNLEIALWGKIDLIKQYVDMTLGLTEQSLHQAFAIVGLPKSFVLQIPMRGPIDDVRINKEVATTRIALLIAKTSGLTQQGGLWGGIAGALHDFANDQTSVPPPKKPFPWEVNKGKRVSHKEQELLNIIR